MGSREQGENGSQGDCGRELHVDGRGGDGGWYQVITTIEGRGEWVEQCISTKVVDSGCRARYRS